MDWRLHCQKRATFAMKNGKKTYALKGKTF